jgi:RecA-family ATPase
MISPELMPAKMFPVLSRLPDQTEFIRQIEKFAPHVIVFDTLTSCFKFDTNDSDAWITVNDFLMRLRFLGYCVIIIHHAGKNNTQRGRTDGDDNLDVSIQLEKREDWEPGRGLEFRWVYTKVRHGGLLQGFEAAYRNGVWQLVEDDRLARVQELVEAGKKEREIAIQMGISQKTVNRLKQV